MNMTDKEAITVLTHIRAVAEKARGNCTSEITVSWTEALSRAISAIERKPRPVIVKGHLFERWYCPACFQRVKKDGRFCHACGQAYRERGFYDNIKPLHIPPPLRRDGIIPPRVVICDEPHKARDTDNGRKEGNMDNFSKRLQHLRERRHISRRVLAELCGLSKNTISRYERGERVPSLTDAAAIADALDVSIDFLCGRREK